MWRGRLPHWRADDVRYYVTFRHRRPLNLDECQDLISALRKWDGQRWQIEVACALPGETKLLARVLHDEDGPRAELSDLVEKAKLKASKTILKRTGEKYPPFFGESFDRIVRDEVEWASFWESILLSPAELAEWNQEHPYPALYVASSDD